MPDTGQVILVGAGPGDPGLLTLAGKAAIDSADVILYDRLVGDGVLAMLPADALKIDVGKNKGRHPVPQDEINRLIVEHALAGKTVVRLKGGDPFLVGRGAEELEEAARAGIPFRVVPGIPSAIAAPAYAGIPVTHRDYASSLHILTGHGKDGSPPDIPYREVAGLRGTLVFLMGVSAVGEICRNLSEAGMAADTPAALVENGTRPNQRRLSATLATLPELAREKAFSSPSVLVVGRVVALADTFDWTARLPLWGKRILTVSSQATGSRLANSLRARGCGVDEFAGISPEPIPSPETLWSGLGQYRWIVFTSQFGADFFFAGMTERGIDVRTLAGVRFAVVGGRTGEVLTRRGIFPDFMPDTYNGQALGDGLARIAKPGERVLLYRAEAGNADLPAALREHDIAFDDVPAYRTVVNAPDSAVRDRMRTGDYDAVTFTSASSVAAFAAAAPEGVFSAMPAFCIGEMTAAAAKRHGLRAEISAEASIESMAHLVVERMGKI